MGRFLTTPLNIYLDLMQTSCTYANHVTIQATSSMLGTHLKIVHANKEDNVVLHPNQTDSRKVIEVGYLEDLQHYVGLDRQVIFSIY